MKRRLLIVRPQPGADATAAAARERGIEPLVAPLSRIEPVAWKVPDASDYSALILSSINALRHGGAGVDRLRTLPVQAVGEKTSVAAKAAGFEVAATAPTGLDELAELIGERWPGRLLRLCGEDHIATPAALTERVETVIVYRSVETALPDGIAAQIAPDFVCIVHSATAASRLRTELAKHNISRDQVHLVAISDRVAKAAGEGWRSLTVAAHPSDAALLDAAASLCL